LVIATSALVILVHPSVAANSVPELIALAKKEPGNLNYASAGPGSGIHLAIVSKLNAALRAALASQKTKAILAGTGADAMPSTPEEYAADIDREETRWSRIVKDVGVKIN
jgi:tripartite-type tricarboxylate transporter receptor subunit TctC